MQFSDFIDRHGLVFMQRPAEAPAMLDGRSLDIMISRKGGEMVTQVNLGEGREFSKVGLMSVMQNSFRMLEADTDADLVARFGENGRATVDKLTHTRDEFRRILGDALFRKFMDEVGLVRA